MVTSSSVSVPRDFFMNYTAIRHIHTCLASDKLEDFSMMQKLCSLSSEKIQVLRDYFLRDDNQCTNFLPHISTLNTTLKRFGLNSRGNNNDYCLINKIFFSFQRTVLLDKDPDYYDLKFSKSQFILYVHKNLAELEKILPEGTEARSTFHSIFSKDFYGENSSLVKYESEEMRVKVKQVYENFLSQGKAAIKPQLELSREQVKEIIHFFAQEDGLSQEISLHKEYLHASIKFILGKTEQLQTVQRYVFFGPQFLAYAKGHPLTMKFSPRSIQVYINNNLDAIAKELGLNASQKDLLKESSKKFRTPFKKEPAVPTTERLIPPLQADATDVSMAYEPTNQEILDFFLSCSPSVPSDAVSNLFPEIDPTTERLIPPLQADATDVSMAYGPTDQEILDFFLSYTSSVPSDAVSNLFPEDKVDEYDQFLALMLDTSQPSIFDSDSEFPLNY